MKFESERLLYREICANDAKQIVQWRSDPEIYRYFLNPKPITLKEHIEWYENIYKNDSSRMDFIFIDKKTNAPAGIVHLIKKLEKTAYLGYLVGNVSFRCKGYATEVLRTFVNEISLLGITDFYVLVHKNNIASNKLVIKCGWKLDRGANDETDFSLYKISTKGD